MSSFINKAVSNITNKTSLIIGRENLTKLANGINKSLFLKSKYREFMKHGNTIQLISKNSHMSLQICHSQNEQSRLILYGNGQIGPEFTNAHWLIEVDPKNGHLKFRNSMNYLSFDKDVPCILTQPPIQPKKTSEQIRARNEFRLHELIGSDEYFALESVYYPGRYLSILPDGSISIAKDKSLESTHFFIHVIHVYNQPANQQTSSSRNSSIIMNDGGAGVGASSTASNDQSTMQSREKEQEAAASARNSVNDNSATSSVYANLNTTNSESDTVTDIPPTYQNLFPVLPK